LRKNYAFDIVYGIIPKILKISDFHFPLESAKY